MKATIFDIKRFAIHDGKGIRTTIFFKGCPLNCIWCHNPESIFGGKDIWVVQDSCIRCNKCLQCPQNAISIDCEGHVVINKNKCDFCGLCIDVCPSNCITRIDKQITTEEIIKEILKDRTYYQVSDGGVTLSGGEPFAQKEFVLDLLHRLKSMGISTCVETSMYCDIKTLEQAVKYTDKFFVDIKLIDDIQHKKYVGKSNAVVLDNFEYLAKNATDIVVRVPLIPRITATYQNLSEIAKYVKSINPDIPIELLNYNHLGHSKYERLGRNCLCFECRPFSDKKFDELKSII